MNPNAPSQDIAAPFRLDLTDAPTYEEMNNLLKEARASVRKHLAEIDRLMFLEKERVETQEERAKLIEEIRRLRDERDPTVVGDLIRKARDAATQASADEIGRIRTENADLRSKVAELSASKKRLREALERAKEKR